MIDAVSPLTRMFGYSTDLRSLTQGREPSLMQFSRYDKVIREKGTGEEGARISNGRSGQTRSFSHFLDPGILDPSAP